MKLDTCVDCKQKLVSGCRANYKSAAGLILCPRCNRQEFIDNNEDHIFFQEYGEFVLTQGQCKECPGRLRCLTLRAN